MVLRPNKVCPVVLRRLTGTLEVLAFEHPLAGRQLVKGTIEPGETIELAALRELAEESGINAAVSRSLGMWSSGHEGHVWAFVECMSNRPLPDTWVHHAPDDGGRAFRFFWQSLGHAANPEQWHAVYRGALSFIHNAA